MTHSSSTYHPSYHPSDSDELEIYHPKRPLDLDSQDSSEEEDQLSEPIKSEEIQVLSHKERRKRRKLANQATLNESDSTSKPKPLPNVSTIKGEYGIWIGNLLYSTTQSEVESFFSNCGKIIRFNFPIKNKINLKSNQHNSGCAYLDFESEENLKKALKKTESLLGGRKVLIKRSHDYSGRPHQIEKVNLNALKIQNLHQNSLKVLHNQSKPPVACLFLGNLSFESTSESIMKHFKLNHQTSNTNSNPNSKEDDPCIRQIRLGTFEDTGKCKGFGFLDFRDTQSATKALMNSKNHHYLGRRIKLEYASEEAARRGGGSHASLNRNKSKLSNHQTQTQNHSNQTQTHSTSRREFQRVEEPRVEEKTRIIEERNLKEINSNQVPKKAFQGRLTPGAALANARRAPIGIIKNPEKVGKKIIF